MSLALQTSLSEFRQELRQKETSIKGLQGHEQLDMDNDVIMVYKRKRQTEILKHILQFVTGSHCKNTIQF